MKNLDKVQEMQILEQNLHNLILQKQAFQMELNETSSALEELSKSGDESYKIIGQLMIKTDKKKIQEDLDKKKKLLELRIKTIEKQEASLTEKFEKTREEVMKSLEKKENQ